MRSSSLIVIALVLAAPLAASLPLAARVDAPSPAQLAARAFDPTDAELLALLGAKVGVIAPTQPPITIPAGETIASVVTRLAARAGVPVEARDVEAFATLDPQLIEPVLTILLATERSWDLYDLATADLTQDEITELIVTGRINGPNDLRVLQLASEVDPAALLAAGILLTDTIESIALPQLRAAADAGVWPANPVADPVGVLRIGGTGDDEERLNRIVQLDARGNDAHYNNAGASTLTNQVFGQPNALMKTPIAVSVDLSGDDHYEMNYGVGSQGAGELGVGFGYLLDLEGDETYLCPVMCQGASSGIARDITGKDYRQAGTRSLGGAGAILYGILRDDAGDDEYDTGRLAGGYGSIPGTVGLLWDREGLDVYAAGGSPVLNAYGWGDGGGHGWLVDEGPEQDTYASMFSTLTYRHACNDCQWTAGSPGPIGPTHGLGNDNAGGLPALLFEQESLT